MRPRAEHLPSPLVGEGRERGAVRRTARGKAAPLGVAALTAALATTPAAAQNGLDNLASIVSLQGTCDVLVARGRDLGADCAGHLMNTAHTDGRSGFSFFSSHEVIDFAGEDSPAVGDRATLHVDMVIVARTDTGGPPHPETIRAQGECTYTNPYAGVSTITCAATTAQGEFRATFRSDGNPPGGGRVK